MRCADQVRWQPWKPKAGSRAPQQNMVRNDESPGAHPHAGPTRCGRWTWAAGPELYRPAAGVQTGSAGAGGFGVKEELRCATHARTCDSPLFRSSLGVAIVSLGGPIWSDGSNGDQKAGSGAPRQNMATKSNSRFACPCAGPTRYARRLCAEGSKLSTPLWCPHQHRRAPAGKGVKDDLRCAARPRTCASSLYGLSPATARVN